MFWIIVLGVAIVAAAYLVGLYNGLVGLRESVKQAWANIDVLLKQRHDELPKLVETCKQYMRYEQQTLEQVMRARASVSEARGSNNVPALGTAENQLRSSVSHLFAVAENYPQLKADQTFQQLQTRITGLEEAIADRREFYNEQVRLNNTRIAQFPDVLLATRFGFSSAPSLRFDASELSDVDVGALFKA